MAALLLLLSSLLLAMHAAAAAPAAAAATLAPSAAAATLAPAPRASRNPKRGFVADGCKGASCVDFELLASAGWYYGYNPEDPYAGSNAPNPRFTPMHWCISTDPIPPGTNATYLLGYNEPNNAHNCNKSPAVIAAAWKEVMQLWGATSILVSPATAGDGRQWYTEFFGNCSALYGARGCQIAHLATHDYSCDATKTLAYLKELHDLFSLPVWLTEMSCGDGADAKPMADHLAYMRAVFPMLDSAYFVYRYAWMSARSANRGLVDTNGTTLTPVGELFVSL
jgi:hypothetical protein